MKSELHAINFTMVIAAIVLAALSVSVALAQSSTPREETWVTNGAVRSIVRTPDTVYIGGDFTYVGPSTGGGVPLDTATGALIYTFPKVDGTVHACVPDGSGGWFIGGYFDKVGNVARNSIAHILANGSVDLTWNPNASNSIFALAVSGSTVYAGGWFTSIGGQTRNHIAAIDAVTGAVTDWNPNASGEVYALTISGSTIYAGGEFTSIGDDRTRTYFAQFGSDGTSTIDNWEIYDWEKRAH